MADLQPRQDFDPGALPEGQEDLAQEDLALELLKSAAVRWQGSEPISLALPRWDAWVIMAALQLVMRHPDAPLKDVVERVGRSIQRMVCDSSELFALAERGWNAAHDVAQGEPAGFTCPRCGMTSHHPDDVREGYCGACHRWTGLHGSITPEIARHVLWHFEAGGYEPGDFTKTLIGLLDRADVDNRGRLARVFPGYAQAVALIDSSLDGVEVLQQIAAGGEPR